jgi:hypothetical protein
VVHDHDAVGHGQRLFLVVGHHDRGDPQAPLQLLDLVAEVDPHLGVERGQGLVQKQEARRGGDRPGQRDALLLAAGKLGRILVALFGQAHQLQQLGDPSLDLGLGRLAVLQAVGDVLLDRQVGEERVGLEHDAEIALRGRQGGDVLAGLLDHAAGLNVQAGDGPQQSGLAAARRPQKTNELALVDLQGNVLERGKGAEQLAQGLDAEKGVLPRRVAPPGLAHRSAPPVKALFSPEPSTFGGAAKANRPPGRGPV